MTIKTVKDAEVEINKLRRELEALKKGTNTGVAPKETITTQLITREVNNIVKEVDSEVTVDGATVIHNLFHIFTQDVKFRGFIAALIHVIGNDTNSWTLRMDESTTNLILEDEEGNRYFEMVNTNAAGLPTNFTYDFHMVPVTTNQNNIGTAGRRIKKLWATDADLGNPLPIASGGTAGNTQATARTALSVYSKAETITEITNAIAAALASYTNTATLTTLLAGKANTSHSHSTINIVSTTGTTAHTHTGTVS